MTTPVGLQQRAAARPTKSLMSGTWASTLLPTIRSAVPARRASSARGRAPKNSTIVGMPFALGDRGDVGGRLDAEHRDAARRRSTAAGSRRWTRPRPPASSARGRTARSPSPRTARHGRATTSRRTRNRRSRSRKSPPPAGGRRPGRGSSGRRPRRPADTRSRRDSSRSAQHRVRRRRAAKVGERDEAVVAAMSALHRRRPSKSRVDQGERPVAVGHGARAAAARRCRSPGRRSALRLPRRARSRRCADRSGGPRRSAPGSRARSPAG